MTFFVVVKRGEAGKRKGGDRSMVVVSADHRFLFYPPRGARGVLNPTLL